MAAADADFAKKKQVFNHKLAVAEEKYEIMNKWTHNNATGLYAASTVKGCHSNPTPYAQRRYRARLHSGM